jgi:hypothetical protein
MLSTILKDGGGHAALKDRYGEPERGEWMGADKNSSQRRWRLQQDEHNFQHTSPTYYPSWPRPRNHWNATGPRNQQPTSPTWERSGNPTRASPTCTGQAGEHHWSDRSLLVKPGNFHRKAPTPVRPVQARKPQIYQTGLPSSKLTQTRNNNYTEQ